VIFVTRAATFIGASLQNQTASVVVKDTLVQDCRPARGPNWVILCGRDCLNCGMSIILRKRQALQSLFPLIRCRRMIASRDTIMILTARQPPLERCKRLKVRLPYSHRCGRDSELDSVYTTSRIRRMMWSMTADRRLREIRTQSRPNATDTFTVRRAFYDRIILGTDALFPICLVRFRVASRLHKPLCRRTDIRPVIPWLERIVSLWRGESLPSVRLWMSTVCVAIVRKVGGFVRRKENVHLVSTR
jgi:hypothetical protein